MRSKLTSTVRKRIRDVHKGLDLGFSDYYEGENVRDLTLSNHLNGIEDAERVLVVDEAMNFSLWQALGPEHPSPNIYVLDLPSLSHPPMGCQCVPPVAELVFPRADQPSAAVSTVPIAEEEGDPFAMRQGPTVKGNNSRRHKEHVRRIPRIRSGIRYSCQYAGTEA
jgi:hypothetical protein